MDLATRLFTILQNPQLVASFQNFCGVDSQETKTRVRTQKKDLLSTRSSKVDDQNNCAQCQHRESIYLANGCESNGNTGQLRGNGRLVSEGSVIAKRHPDDNHKLTPCKCDQPHENGVPVTNGSVPLVEKVEEIVNGELTDDVTNILEPEHWTNFEYDYTVKYNILYYVFKLASGVGNETFFTLFFPYVIWNMDSCVGRRMSMVWFYIMYVGQAMKDLIKLPRPASPPVIRLEKRYEYEYGMPSTHAMIGLAFPFSLLTIMYWRYPNEVRKWAIL
ncbi:sphingosine-1-phosphate phosphatase 1-like [Liolophura sinensis]|uniref:sphingosine-1-phosphate phosphatase 1-like n=1 Tax=Liolophura sinensis TaxID=3198878 RepID=UPI0031591FAA